MIQDHEQTRCVNAMDTRGAQTPRGVVVSARPGKEYDIVFLTNTPSFYKINLCKELGRHCRLLLVLLGYDSQAVNIQIGEDDNYPFDICFLHSEDTDSRNKAKVFSRLVKLLRSIRYKKIIYPGWLAAEYNLLAMITPRHKNVMICESSKFDIRFSGLKGLIKRSIINRMSTVLASGEPHADLFKEIGFCGEICITGGVGIFNRTTDRIHATGSKIEATPLKYLYVGRLIDIKNIQPLVDLFTNNGKQLTVVGDGVLRDQLRKTAGKNISFTGFIENEKIGDIYRKNDVLILPSAVEPWGLVVEEALYWGLPVIVSDKVGSSIDMVKRRNTGIIYTANDDNALSEAISRMEKDYSRYRRNTLEIDWDELDNRQISTYLNLLPKE